MFLQRRCAAATRPCRNASGLLKALDPKHHHTGADPIAFGPSRRDAPVEMSPITRTRKSTE